MRADAFGFFKNNQASARLSVRSRNLRPSKYTRKCTCAQIMAKHSAQMSNSFAGIETISSRRKTLRARCRLNRSPRKQSRLRSLMHQYKVQRIALSLDERVESRRSVAMWYPRTTWCSPLTAWPDRFFLRRNDRVERARQLCRVSDLITIKITNPRNDCISRTVVGFGQSVRICSLAGSGATLAAEIRWPKYSTWSQNRKHFAGFSFSQADRIYSRTACRSAIWFDRFFEKTMTSSRHAKQIWLIRPCRTPDISCW